MDDGQSPDRKYFLENRRSLRIALSEHAKNEEVFEKIEEKGHLCLKAEGES